MMNDPGQPDLTTENSAAKNLSPQSGLDGSPQDNSAIVGPEHGVVTQQPVETPSPTNFNITTNQALMGVVTLLGALLVVHSLRRMNSKKKPPAPAKLGGDMDELLALRNEMYAKYPPPPRTPKVNTKSSGPSGANQEPSLRLVNDRHAALENPAEIAALRQQVEQLSHEIAHLQSRVRDLETARQNPTFDSPHSRNQSPAETPIRNVTSTPSQQMQTSDHENVYRLADRGMNAVEIAKTLGKHTGQVELILNLRRAAGA